MAIFPNGEMHPLVLYGTPGRIRTCDLRIRSPLLYPAELQAPTVIEIIFSFKGMALFCVIH